MESVLSDEYRNQYLERLSNMLCDRLYAAGASASSKKDCRRRFNEMDRLSFLFNTLGIFHIKIFRHVNSAGILLPKIALDLPPRIQAKKPKTRIDKIAPDKRM